MGKASDKVDITPRMCLADYLAMKTKRRKNKFNAVASGGAGEREFPGMRFDSKLEKSLYRELKLRESAGELSDIRDHERIEILPNFMWRVDFNAINTETGIREYFEAKGVESHGYSLQLKAWQSLGPGPLHIYKGDYRRPCLAKTIFPDLELFSTWLKQCRQNPASP